MSYPKIPFFTRIRSGLIGFIYVPFFFGFVAGLVINIVGISILLIAEKTQSQKLLKIAGKAGHGASVFSYKVAQFGYWLEGVQWSWDSDDKHLIDTSKPSLLISNHVAWTDPMIIHALGKSVLPQRKYMFKQVFLSVPIFGTALRFLGMPPVRRYTQSARVLDADAKADSAAELEAQIQQSCRRIRMYGQSAISIFAEGTRRTPGKMQTSGTPYKHLLKPKAGGVAYYLELMPEIDTIIDTTLMYLHTNDHSTLNMFSGGHKKATMHTINRVVPQHLLDLAQRAREAKVLVQKDDSLANVNLSKAASRHLLTAVQEWLNQLWEQKDKLIESYALRLQS